MNEQIIFIAPLLDCSNLLYKLTKIINVPFIIFLIQISHSSNQCKIGAYIKLVLKFILEYGRRFDLELGRRSLKREMIDSMVDSLIDSAPQFWGRSKPQKRVHSKYQYWEYYRFRNDTNIGYIAISKDYWRIELDQ